MKTSQEILSRKLSDILVSDGIERPIAESVSNALVLSEMSGESAHGLRMFPAFREILRLQKEKCTFEVCRENGSFAVIDGAYQAGPYIATKCMQLAIDRAAENGIYTVFAHHANTFGAAFVYSLQAVKQGMIGIVMANTPAQMPVYKGKHRLLGTNPLCYGIPAKDELPIIFDMASSAVAKSRINQAYECGESIPEGWGLDKNANPTTNPQEVLNGGFMLPFADSPKGYGIAMMVDLFAGLLSGAACLDDVGFLKSGKMNVGQVIVAIDPTKIYGDGFYDRVDDYIRKVKAPGENVRLPGEKKLENILKAEKEGFEIDDEIYNKLFL